MTSISDQIGTFTEDEIDRFSAFVQAHPDASVDDPIVEAEIADIIADRREPVAAPAVDFGVSKVSAGGVLFDPNLSDKIEEEKPVSWGQHVLDLLGMGPAKIKDSGEEVGFLQRFTGGLAEASNQINLDELFTQGSLLARAAGATNWLVRAVWVPVDFVLDRIGSLYANTLGPSIDKIGNRLWNMSFGLALGPLNGDEASETQLQIEDLSEGQGVTQAEYRPGSEAPATPQAPSETRFLPTAATQMPVNTERTPADLTNAQFEAVLDQSIHDLAYPERLSGMNENTRQTLLKLAKDAATIPPERRKPIGLYPESGIVTIGDLIKVYEDVYAILNEDALEERARAGVVADPARGVTPDMAPERREEIPDINRDRVQGAALPA